MRLGDLKKTDAAAFEAYVEDLIETCEDDFYVEEGLIRCVQEQEGHVVELIWKPGEGAWREG